MSQGYHGYHDSRCERVLTEGGVIFIDCNCCYREDLANAWDEGYYHATNGKWGPPEDGANPYR